MNQLKQNIQKPIKNLPSDQQPQYSIQLPKISKKQKLKIKKLQKHLVNIQNNQSNALSLQQKNNIKILNQQYLTNGKLSSNTNILQKQIKNTSTSIKKQKEISNKKLYANLEQKLIIKKKKQLEVKNSKYPQKEKRYQEYLNKHKQKKDKIISQQRGSKNQSKNYVQKEILSENKNVVMKAVQQQQKNKVHSQNNNSFEVCVMQIPLQATQQDIKQHFKECGDILSIKMLRKKNEKFKGLAFIKFSLKQSFKKALKLNQSEMGGKTIKVALAKKKEVIVPVAKQEKKKKSKNNINNNHFEEQKPVIIDNPTIFIGGLSFQSTKQSMEQFFSQCGKINSVRIAQDRQTGKQRGFGYVEFSSIQEAKKAYDQLNGEQLDGRKIRINSAKVKDHTQKRQRLFPRANANNSKYSHVELSQDDKNAKSGAIGLFQGKKVLFD